MFYALALVSSDFCAICIVYCYHYLMCVCVCVCVCVYLVSNVCHYNCAPFPSSLLST